MSTYTLPDLTYDYGALEPNISGKIMELHHDKHHLAYVNGANTALEQMEEARATNNLANINKLQKDLAFHLAGHVNHTVFWRNLLQKEATSLSASLLPRLMNSLAVLTHSVRISPRLRWAFREAAGRFLPGTALARS